MRVWCVKHRHGWCAVKSNRQLPDSAWSIPTSCGYYIYLPYGTRLRMPTCPECIKKIGKSTRKEV